MSSEKEEKKVLSRREALKRIAVVGAGVAAVAATGVSFSKDCYGSYLSTMVSGGPVKGGSYSSTC